MTEAPNETDPAPSLPPVTPAARRRWRFLLVLPALFVVYLFSEQPQSQTLRIDLGETRAQLRKVALACSGPGGEAASTVWHNASFGRFLDFEWLSTAGTASCEVTLFSAAAQESFERQLDLDGQRVLLHASNAVARLAAAASSTAAP
jgi:hypothetical protein